MSTAEVIQFPVREIKRVADLEDGYTRIANDLLEAFYKSNLTERQFKVVMFIMRKTYGFGKKSDYMTNTQIAEEVNVHHTHVCKAKNDLIDRKIIILDGRKLGVNKNISEWILAKSANVSRISKKLAESANKSLAKPANTDYPNQLNTKETILKEKRNKKKINKKEIPPKNKSTSFPEGFTPKESHKNLANELGLSLIFEFGKFKDRNLAKDGKYVNWDSAFNNWLRKAYEYKHGGKSFSTPQAVPKQTKMTPEQKQEYDRYMFMHGISS